jgi:hypothetical protein
MDNINFSKNLLGDLTDREYFSIGDVDLFNHKALVASASFFGQVFNRDLYDVLLGGGKITDDLQYVFDTGSAFHCYCLEDDFDERFIVADFKTFDNEKIFIKTEDFEFIKEARKNIAKKYPFILEKGLNENVFIGNFDGVPYRAKMDKIIDTPNEIKVIDLKSVWFDFYSAKYRKKSDGIRWSFLKHIQELNYDLQGYCYKRAIDEHLEYQGKDVNFYLLMASKETGEVKMFKFSPETLEHGKKKFDLIFPEIKSFFDHGLSHVEKDEIL